MALRPPFSSRSPIGALDVSLSAGVILALLLAAIVGLHPADAALAKGPEAVEQPYGLLLSYIQMDDRNGPLVEFRQTGRGVDRTLNQENRAYLSRNNALLDKIRTELDSDALRWKLRRATQRLMVVPETHPGYAALFESYCRAAVDFVLEQTQLPNPYGAIATLAGPPTDAPGTEASGITAYLVHNIADVYSEEYIFFDESNQDRKISIKLDNRSYRGEIGSYSSFLVIEEDQRYRFERNAYTLWRNSAENPLNVFIAPVEETLHIALRTATETAIRARLNETPPATRNDILAVVDEWLAVEEAVVGGLVSALMPAILDRFLTAEGASLDLAQSLDERQAFDKYRYLPRGVALVDRMGMQPAIRFYLDRPRKFKALLTEPESDTAAPPVEAAEEKAPEDPAV